VPSVRTSFGCIGWLPHTKSTRTFPAESVALPTLLVPPGVSAIAIAAAPVPSGDPTGSGEL
jgi:hypothetical protein